MRFFTLTKDGVEFHDICTYIDAYQNDEGYVVQYEDGYGNKHEIECWDYVCEDAHQAELIVFLQTLADTDLKS